MKESYEVARDIIRLCDVSSREMEAIETAVSMLQESSDPNLKALYNALSRISENIDL